MDQVSAGAFPDMVIGQSEMSLSLLATEHPDFTSKLSSFDPLYLASTFAGMLTAPAFDGNCLRLEALIHFAICFASGTQKPGDKFIANAFDILGGGTCGSMEDSPEDVFVSLVRSPRGNFRIINGIWEGNAFYLQRFIGVLEDMPPTEYYSEIRDAVYALLSLSEMLCERGNLVPYTLGKEVGAAGLTKRHLQNLPRRRAHVRFSATDLANAGVTTDSLRPFIFDLAGREVLRAVQR